MQNDITALLLRPEERVLIGALLDRAVASDIGAKELRTLAQLRARLSQGGDQVQLHASVSDGRVEALVANASVSVYWADWDVGGDLVRRDGRYVLAAVEERVALVDPARIADLTAAVRTSVDRAGDGQFAFAVHRGLPVSSVRLSSSSDDPATTLRAQDDDLPATFDIEVVEVQQRRIRVLQRGTAPQIDRID